MVVVKGAYSPLGGGDAVLTCLRGVAAGRPLRKGGWLPRPLGDDAMLGFLGVLAVVGVKIIMSTALASWFLVAGQLLFAIADITGSSQIFGNGSPLVFIFQALPLVEILLQGSATFEP